MEIFNHIEEDLTKYWKNVFTTTILSKIDIKEYYSRNVIPKLDKGWRLVAIRTHPCARCELDGFAIPNPFCNDCEMLTPCLNCYWYNYDPLNIGAGCFCSRELNHVSWEDIREQYHSYGDVRSTMSFEELKQSSQWKRYMEREYELAIEVDRENARIDAERQRIRENIQRQIGRLTADIQEQLEMMYGEWNPYMVRRYQDIIISYRNRIMGLQAMLNDF